MSFSEFDVTRRTRKGNFLKQIDQLIDWNSIEKAIAVYYTPICDAAGRPVCSGLLLFKMLLREMAFRIKRQKITRCHQDNYNAIA
ncbi:MAG: hypothetical protein WAU15_07965 [Nitrosomonas sp.]